MHVHVSGLVIDNDFSEAVIHKSEFIGHKMVFQSSKFPLNGYTETKVMLFD